MRRNEEKKEQKEAGEKGSLPAGSSISYKHVMEDPEATDNFITHKLTKKLQLPSKATAILVKVVGECQLCVMKHTSVYKICLTDLQGRKDEVEAISMERLLAIDIAPEAWEFKLSNSQVQTSMGRRRSAGHTGRCS